MPGMTFFKTFHFVLTVGCFCFLPSHHTQAQDMLAFNSEEMFLDDTFNPVPIILTTSRLHQPQSEAPASMTIIDREMIEMLGARDIPELLRLVPGMAVANVDGNIPSVSYHATNSKDIKRMQVLIDGRSVYQAGLARVLWNDLPYTVDDIDRIEVTRGPNAAAYGPNSFTGVINIITQHPNDTLGLKARIAQGNNGTSDTFLRGGAEIGNISYRVSAFTRGDNGYNKNFEGQPRRDAKQAQGLNFKSVAQINTQSSLELHFGLEKTELQLDPIDGWENFGTFESVPDQESNNHFLMVKWQNAFSDKHSLSIQAYRQKSQQNYNWQSCMNSEPLSLQTNLLFSKEAYLLREAYRTVLGDALSYEEAGVFAAQAELLTETVASGLGPNPDPVLFQNILQSQAESLLGRSLFAEEADLLLRARDIALANSGDIPLLCGEVDTTLTEGRSDIEVVDRMTLNDQFRVVSGFGLRRETVDSNFFMNGSASNESYRLFAHMEYRPFKPLLINIGGHYEGDGIGSSDFSPRVAINYHLHEHHTLRLVRSTATRSIDIYESDAANRIYLNNINSPYRNNTLALLGQPEAVFYMRENMDVELKSETIESVELGYYGYIARQLEIDVRIFEEKLEELISEGINIVEFEPNNNNYATLQGAEAQIKWHPGNHDLLLLNMAYLDNESSDRIEHRLTAKGSGMFMWNHRFDSDLNVNLAYFLADKYNPYGSLDGLKFERIDLGLKKQIKHNDTLWSLSLKAMHRLNDNPIVTGDNNYPSQNSYFFSIEAEI